MHTISLRFCKYKSSIIPTLNSDEETKDLVETITTFAELGFGMMSRDIDLYNLMSSIMILNLEKRHSIIVEGEVTLVQTGSKVSSR